MFTTSINSRSSRPRQNRDQVALEFGGLDFVLKRQPRYGGTNRRGRHERLALRERDLGGLVDALLDEGEVDEAWSVAHEPPDWEPGLSQRLRLAEARGAQRPDQALPWYMLVVDELLIETGRRSYARAVPVLKRARRAAEAAGQTEWFATQVADLREHRRRPTLIAMLDKASLG